MKTYLAPAVMSSFNSALMKLTGYEKREFAAELCEEYFDGSPRKMERCFNVSRDMVSLGLHERRTGIRCIDAYELRGAKKKK
ncbi:MAG: hypothetical protein PSV35_08540 [bacterium]|nr:hypothetical protein [bacterium]